MKRCFVLVGSFLSISVLANCSSFDDEVTIIYTNDTHGEINKNLSFATVGRMKQKCIEDKKNVLLLDAGDHISGGFYTTYDKGKSMIELMNMAGYDASTLGNHEFDYTFDYLKDLMKLANYPYISTNFYHMKDNKPTTRFTDVGSKIFYFNNVRVGVIGISTPESITTSTPSHFQDKDGNFIYTFMDDEMYKTAQEEINKIRANCSFVICLSHLGDEDQDNQFTATKLAKNTTGIDVILDGHTHKTVLNKVVKDKDNKDVVITQAGGKFSRIGKMTISRKGISNEFISESAYIDNDIKNKEKSVIKALDDSLSKKIATSDIKFTVDGSQESNLGDLVAEAPYYYYNKTLVEKGESTQCDVAFVNSGGIRSSVDAGEWTLKTCKNIHPFGNEVALVKMKGSLLRTALEFSSYKMPEYFGGLQQICGVQYTVNTNVTSDIKVDSHGNWVSGPSKDYRRLTDIQIYNKTENKFESLNDDKEYYVGGSAYVILDGGDGCAMFKQAEFIRKESDVVDFDVLVNYINNFEKGDGLIPIISSDNSPLKAFPNLTINYENTAGRITAKQ